MLNVEVRVELGTGGVGHTVPGPGFPVIRLIGEMRPWINVEVFGRHDVVVAVVTGEKIVDRLHDCRGAGHRERTTLAEIVLYIDDEERSHTFTVSADRVARPAIAVQ